MPTGNIFESYLARKPLFKDREVMRPAYIPDELPHREVQINYLASILSTALRGERPSNILIYGKTGTGKTAVVKYLGQEIQRFRREMGLDPGRVPRAEEFDQAKDNLGVTPVREGIKTDPTIAKVRFIYINCQNVVTTYGILANIGNEFVKDWSSMIPFTGWPMERVYRTLRNNVEDAGGVTVVVLDEVDQLVYHSGDDVLYHLTDINTDLEKAKLSLIGISNELKFTELLDPRVVSRLGEERMTFPPYNATQLGNILWQRARLGLVEGCFSEAVIRRCAALAAEEHGDARKALELLRVAAEIAEREGATTIVEEHVDRAQSNIERDLVAEVLRTLPIQAKVVLSGIVMVSRNPGEVAKLTTGDVYDLYCRFADAVGVNRLTQRRVTDIISELDMLGIINARVINKGRYGRTREIELSVGSEDALDILLEDEILEPLKRVNLREIPQQRLF